MNELKSAFKLLTMLTCCLATSVSFAQTIYLNNPSFEDIPGHSRAPRGWSDCGFIGESAPDVQPSGTWDVYKEASHGHTYLGMVVRDNETWESVGQALSSPLKKGTTYKFSLDLCTSEIYRSSTRSDLTTKHNFVTPIKLRIYGGKSICDKAVLLDETDAITNNNWKTYHFTFNVRTPITHIVLEAYYVTPVMVPYNGNVLVDNASAIVEVKPEEPKVVKNNESKPTSPAMTFQGKSVAKGQVIRIDELHFEADTSSLSAKSYKALNQLFNFMQSNPKVRIEIGGHTNGIPSDAYCDKLSTDRAKVVADYLIKKGIDRSRITHKGYGKRKPLASDKTADGRKKNQRVEIKILSA